MCLLFGDAFEEKHWMLSRLLRRSGTLNRDDFFYATASEPRLREQLIQHKVKVVVPLGERALRETLLGERDILRWRGRVAEFPFLQDTWVVPTFAPSKLLPRRGDDDSDDKMRHPPRYHGVWIHDVRKAMHIAEHGFERRDGIYLLDPPA